MYSEKLEELIALAIQDGNLTEQKRNIISRRAEKEGEDVEEVMMVVEARLHQSKNDNINAFSQEMNENNKTPDSFVETIGPYTFEMLKIKGGPYTLYNGSEEYYRADCQSWMISATRIELQDYYISKTPVSQGLWRTVMKSDSQELPWLPKGDNYPALDRWNKCNSFINNLNRITHKNYHLPSEAQWEYAAVGGKSIKNFELLKNNFYGQVNEPISCSKPNNLGIYDMIQYGGEWCLDDYGVVTSLKGPECVAEVEPCGSNKVVKGFPFKSEKWTDYLAAYYRNAGRNFHCCRLALQCP